MISIPSDSEAGEHLRKIKQYAVENEIKIRSLWVGWSIEEERWHYRCSSESSNENVGKKFYDFIEQLLGIKGTKKVTYAEENIPDIYR